MDVTAESFHFHFPRILEALTTCCFVSIDFEFTGIPVSQGKARSKTSLQERYEETKKAADKYQIVQVGLTTCHEDTQRATYTLKAYNIFLSPLIDDSLDIQRDSTFQSGALRFLLENNFSLDALYKDGVPYLSRDEETRAMNKAAETRNRSSTIDVDDSEHESIAFLNAIRKLVDAWRALGDKREKYLNIPPPSSSKKSKPRDIPTDLNRFQKRLVHQLIEVEYPHLKALGRDTFIQIIDYDEKREKAAQTQRIQRIRERIWNLKGFAWVAEALAGGDLSNLDPYAFINIWDSKTHLKEFSDGLEQALRSHRPVLVGHNLFMDLIYFCRCFYGPLPDRVEDFQAMAGSLFPMVVDTKYVATHDCGSINPVSSLSEINDSLKNTDRPRIKLHPHHLKYAAQEVDHEAGYDSMLTAQVFIKLSAQLRDKDKSADPEGSLSIAEADNKGAERAPNLEKLGTKFDILQLNESDDHDISSATVAQKAATGDLIPRLDSNFWRVYGNKLRVFGTDERVCIIGGGAEGEVF